MDLGLSGMRALITGSSSGLGLATAFQLLLEGASVCINGRTQNKLDFAVTHLSKFKNVFAYSADITQEEKCEDLVRFAKNNMGGIDI